MSVRKFAQTSVVSEDERTRTTAIDLLDWHEEKVLTELVRAVHKAGYVGDGWPSVEREPVMRNLLDEWERCDPEDAERWFVRAFVVATPR